MSATNSNGGSQRKNYYSVSYGKLSTRQKEVPENSTEIVEADLKSKIQNVEQIDLRNKYVNKAKGDYPYQVFYDNLEGTVQDYEKYVGEENTNLNLTVLDSDGDTSILQMKFYSKYAESALNRLLNTNSGDVLTFTPYQIPTSAEIDGKPKAFYNQGISIKSGGNKVEVKYKNDDDKLPKTEQVKVSGKTTTSRDNRLDFLFDEFEKNFKKPEGNISARQNVPTATPQQAFDTAKSFAPDPAGTKLPF